MTGAKAAWLLALALTMAAPGAAFAAGSNIITGFGEDHCAAVNAAYAKDEATAHASYYAWAEGFISGMNLIYVETNGRGLDLSSEVPGMHETFLKDFCGRDPDSTYAEAVVALSNTLEPGPNIPKK